MKVSTKNFESKAMSIVEIHKLHEKVSKIVMDIQLTLRNEGIYFTESNTEFLNAIYSFASISYGASIEFIDDAVNPSVKVVDSDNNSVVLEFSSDEFIDHRRVK